MNFIKHQLGLGFNPAFITGELPVPEECHYIEAGNNLFQQPDVFNQLKTSARSFSLHLARVPFCEPENIQHAFVQEILNSLPSEIESIGLHLCGSYRDGLGVMGLGTDFRYSEETAQQSRRFMEILSAHTERTILLENANFYDHNPQQAIATIEHTNRLCQEYNLGLILDLAHLIMNAHNLGLNPYFLLGKIDLTRIAVIHLSGIVEGGNGIWHDGHTEPVHQEVWSMLEFILPLLQQSVKIVLEHSDSNWINQVETFQADWIKANQCLTEISSNRQQSVDFGKIGMGYFANVVFPKWFPDLVDYLGKPTFKELVSIWGKDFLSRLDDHPTAYVAVGKPQYLNQAEDCLDPIEDFRLFVQNNFDVNNVDS